MCLTRLPPAPPLLMHPLAACQRAHHPRRLHPALPSSCPSCLPSLHSSERIINVTSISLSDGLDFGNLQARGVQCMGSHGCQLSPSPTPPTCLHACLSACDCISRLHPARRPPAPLPLRATARLQGEREYERVGHAAYSQSKLALNMWSFLLAAKLRKASRKNTRGWAVLLLLS